MLRNVRGIGVLDMRRFWNGFVIDRYGLRVGLTEGNMEGSVVSIGFRESGTTAVARDEYTVGTPATSEVNPEYVSAVIKDPTYVNTERRI